ncbi:MAG TPA: class II aldolase/adducin family protein, partial [Gemmataceae bacterium]
MGANTNSPRSALQRRKASEPRLDRDFVDDLVAAYRTLASLNVLDAFGHVSVRDPRNPNRYLMSRSVAPESVTPADILVLDLDSGTIDPADEGKLLYRERFIHGEIYKVRPDVNAVVHSHSPTVVPFTVTRAKLRPLLHNAGFLGFGAPLFEIRNCAGDGTDL